MKRRRFWKSVEVTGAVAPYAIALDGRPVKTPCKATLALPTRALADAVASEWAGQGEKIDPSAMPMTRLANTAIDRVKPEQERIVSEIVEFAGSDLVCYRAAEPDELIRRQAEEWDPILDWARKRLDASFLVTAGVVHRAQAETSLARMRAFLDSHDEWALTAIHNMTTLTGSALIAAMIAEAELAAEAGWAAAHVDEDWQISRWGADEEAAERRERRRMDFLNSVMFLRLAAGSKEDG
jgi:chaperone required for assembly of F1-ATPase